MYALIDFAGKQFKVEEGSSIKVPYVDEKVGTKITFDKVLFLDDGKTMSVGTPTVAGAKIESEIISHGRERKVVVFKFKRRKGYQKKNTHRQEYSILKVGKMGKIKKAAKPVAKPKAAPKKATKSAAKPKATPKKATKSAAKPKAASKEKVSAKQKDSKE